MAGTIERREQIGQQQDQQHDQEQVADDAQGSVAVRRQRPMRACGLKWNGDQRHLPVLLGIVRHFMPSQSLARLTARRTGGIDEAGVMTDGPPDFDPEPRLMTTMTASIDFAKRLDRTAEETEALLGQLLSDDLLPDEIARPKRLMDAMRYSSLGGGKRLRPFLVVESSAVFGVPREAALLAGAALECIHCYSLIHDDLPAMDNSDLRRGRPTLHKKTDDATAILAATGC